MTQAISAQTMQVPRQGLCFAAAVTLDASPTAAAGPRRFSGVAYGGGVITDHGWWDAVSFDLAGVTAATPMPLLMNHDGGQVIGVIDTVTNDGTHLAIGGKLFTGIDPAADQVAAKAEAGAAWQMSVGIFPDRIEEIASGTAYSVNGRNFTGPGHVFRAARVRETSFVALGADASTRATVFSTDGAAINVPVFSGAPKMADTTVPNTPTIEQLAAQVATLTVERDAAVAAHSALQEQFSARTQAERETAVKALLGEEFSAEAAAPYMGMTPEQFAAVQAVLSKRSALPTSFTTEQATGGAGKFTAAAGELTPDAIRTYRRVNPGATYEQAFGALTGQGQFVAPATF